MELGTMMTIASLLLGFGLSFGASQNRESMGTALKEDKKFYRSKGLSFAGNYQGSFMSTSFLSTCFGAVALFCTVTTYVAFRTLKPTTGAQSSLFYKLFQTELQFMYASLYTGAAFLCVSAYYGWTINTRVNSKSNLHYFYSGNIQSLIAHDFSCA